MRPTRLMRGSVALCLASIGGSAAAQESQKQSSAQECAQAYEDAQEHRSEGRLGQAGEALLICAQAHCPAFVQTDCAQWLTEVKKEMPSVIFEATDPGGQETAAVSVTVDGERVMDRLDGRAFTLNPGEHVFRFDFDGQKPITRTLMIQQGEQERRIQVSWQPTQVKEPSEAAPRTVDKDASVFVRNAEDFRLASYITAGAGVVSLGVGIGFWVAGKGEDDAFLAECGGLNPQGQCVNFDYSGDASDPTSPNAMSIQRAEDAKASSAQKYTIGNITAIAGGVLIATGVTLFLLTEPWSSNSTALVHDVRWMAAPSPDGGFCTVSGSF